MPSDQEQSPLMQGSPLIGGSGRSVVPSPQLQQNIVSNSNVPKHPMRPRPSSSIIQDSAPPASPSITAMSAPYILPATSAPLHARHMRNESNKVFFSPDPGNVEFPLPTRGPLNHNITMGLQRQASGSSEVSFASSKSLTPMTGPSTPLLLSTRLPNLSSDFRPHPFTEDNIHTSRDAPSGQLGYKPRTRKNHTKETAPDDIQAVVALGMAPFMIGQDAIWNQNRLVRNEAILTQQVLRLRDSQYQSESVHATREEDIYRRLQEHTVLINNISVVHENVDAGASAGAAHTSSSLRTDPDFTALFQAQADMRNRLDHLMADVAATTLSTELTLERLDERIRQLAANVLTQVPPTPTPTPLLAHDTLLPRLTQMTRSVVSPERVLRKRKRDELLTNVTPSRPGSGYGHRAGSHHHHLHEQGMEGPGDDTSMDVVYGPISFVHRGGGSSSNYADDDDDDDDNDNNRDNWSPSRIRTIANEALRDVGLSPRLIHSVRRAHDAPDSINIRFVKYEHAARFVEFVRTGRDGYSNRRARLAERPLMWSTENGLEERVASGSNSNATMWE